MLQGGDSERIQEQLPRHLIITVCPPRDVFVRPKSQTTKCAKCEKMFRDYGSCKVHELLQHSVLDGGVTFESEEKSGKSKEVDAISVICPQEIRYCCPVAECRYALPEAARTPHKSTGRTFAKSKFFVEMRYLKEHFLRLHNPAVKSLQCPKCSLKCRTESELRRHEPFCRLESCSCGKTLRTRCGYLSHIKKCHAQKEDDVKRSAPRKGTTHAEELLLLSNMRPLAPRSACVVKPLEEPRPTKPASILSINSCVQTTESALSRYNLSRFSKGAQCIPTERRCTSCLPRQAQPEGIFPTKHSGVQTIAILREPAVSLKIDSFSQTDLLDENEGLSSQDACEILLFLEAEDGFNMSSADMTTQTDEAELAPFSLPSTSIQTQTSAFACGSQDLFLNLTEDFSVVNTLNYRRYHAVPEEDQMAMDLITQEPVDMQTQTLEGLESCLVWDFTDADTQTTTLGFSNLFS